MTEPTIDLILEPGEKKEWEGRINRKVLLFSLVFGLIVTFVIAGFLFTKSSLFVSETGGGVSGFMAGGIVAGLGLLANLYGYFSSLVKRYAITGKRVLIRSGIIGTDFKSIYYDQIQNIIVDVGIVGKIFHVGDVKIDTGKTETFSTGGHSNSRGQYRGGQVRTRTVYDVLRAIEEPYEVYKKLESSLTGRRESLFSGRADAESLKAQRLSGTPQ